MPHDKRVSYGVALLIWRSSRILLLKRAGPHATGFWACPGGWVDYHELSRATCIREAHEELGVDVAVGKMVALREHWFDTEEVQSASLYYDAIILEGEPRIMEPDKHSAVCWVDPTNPVTWPEPLFPKLGSVLHEIAANMGERPLPPLGGRPCFVHGCTSPALEGSDLCLNHEPDEGE